MSRSYDVRDPVAEQLAKLSRCMRLWDAMCLLTDIVNAIVPLAAAYQKGREDERNATPRCDDEVGRYR